MIKQGLLGLSVAMAVAWGASPVVAGTGDDGPAVRSTARRGWTGGLAVGMGELHHFNLSDARPDTISEGAAVSLRLGKALHQRTLFMLEIEYVLDGTVTSHMAGAYGQFYLSNRWWFRAGGGLTRLRQSGSEEPELPERHAGSGPLVFAASSTVLKDRYSLGAVGGIGADFFQTHDLALSAEFTLMLSYYNLAETEGIDDELILANVGLLLGIQWY